MQQHIVIKGNPVDGFEFHGPFSTRTAAISSAETVGSDWWVAPCESGDDPETDTTLALWFTPQAIRDHFDGDDADPTEGMSDAELVRAGRTALDFDSLYREFHDSLNQAVREVKDGQVT